jgi:DNA-binding NarL/FixJ family response regulator
MQQQGNRGSTQDQPTHRETAPAHVVFARGYPRGTEARETCYRDVWEGGNAIMTPREHLTPKEIQISILVWEGMTNREISKIVGTTEQVIKNHLRSTFDKLGVWSRLELAMYVQSHGGKGWPDSENTVEACGQAIGAD